MGVQLRTLNKNGQKLRAHLIGIGLALSLRTPRKAALSERWDVTPEPLLRNESPTEYFRDLVESALQHQHIVVRDLTSYYVVNLLTGFMHRDRSGMTDGEALGIRFV